MNTTTAASQVTPSSNGRGLPGSTNDGCAVLKTGTAQPVNRQAISAAARPTTPAATVRAG